jgi:hypothetical protein
VTSDHFLFRDKAGRAKFLVGLHGYAVAVEVRWSIFFLNVVFKKRRNIDELNIT